MHGEKIRLSKEDEPYLATLYGKALDADAPDSILGDVAAAEAVRRIDFDFTKLRLPRDGAISLPVRAKHLDGWTREFLAAHPSATVLHLGCGLDTRVQRLDPAPSVRWLDVDLPDVIALRKKLYPPRDGYELVASSVTDLRWLDAVPTDRPVIVVAEGLVMYLTEADGLALFNRITKTFPSGELVFDAYATLTTRVITLGSRLTGMGVRLTWGIDDPERVARGVERLRLVDAVPFVTLPELVARMSRTPVQKLAYRLIGRSGFMRRSIRHLRYRF